MRVKGWEAWVGIPALPFAGSAAVVQSFHLCLERLLIRNTGMMVTVTTS